MSREKGDIFQCIGMALHHIASHKARLMAFAGALDPEVIEYRFGLAREQLENAAQRFEAIKKIAEERGYADVLAIINEESEYGHRE